jgi:hypothetical protein
MQVTARLDGRIIVGQAIDTVRRAREEADRILTEARREAARITEAAHAQASLTISTTRSSDFRLPASFTRQIAEITRTAAQHADLASNLAGLSRHSTANMPKVALPSITALPYLEGRSGEFVKVVAAAGTRTAIPDASVLGPASDLTALHALLKSVLADQDACGTTSTGARVIGHVFGSHVK